MAVEQKGQRGKSGGPTVALLEPQSQGLRICLALGIFSHPKIIYPEGTISGARQKGAEKRGRRAAGSAERASAGVSGEVHLWMWRGRRFDEII